MNSAVSGVIKYAQAQGLETYIIKDGYLGLYNNWIEKVDSFFADGIISRGGTAAGSARFPEFQEEEIREKAIKNLKDKKIEALVVIGGDGSYKGAQRLSEMGINCIALPGTIDNDISSSEQTIGFDTALNIIVDSIDRIRDTSQSHSRCTIIEVMGRHCGDLALYGGIAGGADIVSIGGNPLSEEDIIEKVTKLKGIVRSVVVVVSEHLYDSVHELAKKVQEASGFETRASVLGHIQRGGKPTAMDRFRAFTMGIRAVELILDGKSGLALGNVGEEIVDYPILEALEIPRKSRKKLWTQFNNLNIRRIK